MAELSKSTNAAWLAMNVEEALEPDLPICDPHQHFWDFRTDTVHPHYMLDEFVADISGGHNIISTVFLDCHAMYRTDGPEELRVVGETEFVNGIAAMSASGQYGPTRAAAGIVSYADLSIGDRAGAVLEAHISAGGGRFKGIRQAGAWDADDRVRSYHTIPPAGMLGSDKFRQGFAHMGRLGLSYDCWVYHPQLAEVVDLARAFPDTTIILDHMGGPIGVGPYAGKRAEVMEQWRQGIAEVAKSCPNIVVKLGGINMKFNGFDWHERDTPPTSAELAEANRPYFEHCLEHFGVDRCVFESNFPIEKISCDYTTVWNLNKRIAEGFSADEKAKLFHDNAARVYRLGSTP
jgi:L-fuconolactonase